LAEEATNQLQPAENLRADRVSAVLDHLAVHGAVSRPFCLGESKKSFSLPTSARNDSSSSKVKLRPVKSIIAAN
jgi:hypothetical protein